MDYSLPGSSVYGIFQARILEQVAIPFSRGSSQTRGQAQVSCIARKFFTIWATRDVFFFSPLFYQHTNEDIPLLPSSGLKQGLTPSISLQTTWLQKCLKIFGHLFLHLWDISSVSAAAAAVKSAVVSDSVRPHRQQPSRLLCPWDSLGKNTGVGCHCFLWSSVSRSYHKVQSLAHDWNIFNTILCYPN